MNFELALRRNCLKRSYGKKRKELCSMRNICEESFYRFNLFMALILFGFLQFKRLEQLVT